MNPKQNRNDIAPIDWLNYAECANRGTSNKWKDDLIAIVTNRKVAIMEFARITANTY
jgi:hypothetical protein